MSNKKKNRKNKKHVPLAKNQVMARCTMGMSQESLEKHCERIWMASTTTTDKIHTGGMVDLTSTGNATMVRNMQAVIFQRLRETRRPWTLTCWVFKTVMGANTYHKHTYDFHSATSKSIDSYIIDGMMALWDKTPEEERVSMGWCAFPSGYFDIDSNLNDFLDYFKSQKVWDREVVEKHAMARRLAALDSAGKPVAKQIDFV